MNQGVENFIDNEDEIASDNLACSSTDEESDGDQLLVNPPSVEEQENSLSPKSDSPKSDSPKSDSPKSDSPKSDSPKSDSQNSESPKSNDN